MFICCYHKQAKGSAVHWDVFGAGYHINTTTKLDVTK